MSIALFQRQRGGEIGWMVIGEMQVRDELRDLGDRDPEKSIKEMKEGKLIIRSTGKFKVIYKKREYKR